MGGTTLEQVFLGCVRMVAEHEPWREQAREQHFFLVLPSDSCLAILVLPDSPQRWAVMECESSKLFPPQVALGCGIYQSRRKTNEATK